MIENTPEVCAAIQRMWPDENIPDEITEAAVMLDKFFKERGLDKWELMGVASRNYVEERDEARREAEVWRQVVANLNGVDGNALMRLPWEK